MKSLKEQFVDWVKAQPRDKEYEFYNFMDGECGCAITQFTHTLGLTRRSDAWMRLHHDACEVAEEPYTFGALANRLEAMK